MRSHKSRPRRNAASALSRSLMLGAIAAVSAAAHASDSNYWTGNGSSLFWDEFQNWLLGAPGGDQWLYIGYDGWAVYPRPAYTEMRTGSVSVSRLYSTSDFTLSGGTLHLTDSVESGLINARFTLSGGSLVNDGALGVDDFTWSSGTLSGPGTLNVANDAQVTGLATWTAGNIGLTAGHAFSVAVAGTLNAATGVKLTGGILSNSGAVNFADYNSQNVWAVDVISNTGSITQKSDYGNVSLTASAVSNSGTISSNGYWGTTMNVASTGGFTNAGTASAVGSYYNSLSLNAADFDNQGTLRSGGTQGSWISAIATNDFTNSGLIVSSGDWYDHLTSQAGGNYLNTGTIQANGYYDAWVEAFANGGTFTNQGTIVADNANYAYGRVNTYGSAGLINEGTYDLNTNGSYGRLWLNSGGDVSNAVGAQILNRGGGYNGIVDSHADGNWTNAGTISTTGYYAYTYLSADGDFLNTGSIAASNYGTHLEVHADGTLTNQGTIEKHGYGDVRLGGGAGTDNSTGTIVGDGTNVWMDGKWSRPTLGTLVPQNGATFRLAGTLDNAGYALDPTTFVDGSFWIDGGTVKGGSIVNSTLLKLSGNGNNTLENVTLDGGLRLVDDDFLRLRNTPIVPNTAIVIGDPNVSYYVSNTLALDQDQTLAGNVVSMNAGYYYYVSGLAVENGHVLTIDPTSSIVGNSVRIFGSGGASLENQGTITGSYRSTAYPNEIGSGMSLLHNAATGTITSDGGEMRFYASAFHNEGLARSINGGYLELNGALDNDGQIRAVGAGSRVRLYGAFVNDPVTGLSWNDVKAVSGGEIQLGGSIDNTGATLDPVAAAGDGTFRLVGGTITGGSLANSDSLRADSNWSNGLYGVALDGGLNLSEPNATLRIGDGTTLGPSPTLKIGPSADNYYTGRAYLNVARDLSLVDADVQFGTNYYWNALHLEGSRDLSLDAATQLSGRMNVYEDGDWAHTLTNLGTVTATGAGGEDAYLGWGFGSVVNGVGASIGAKDFGAAFNLYAPNFDNQGSIVADNSTVRYWASANGGTGTMHNAGAISAINGGYLGLYQALDNTGVIRADGANSRLGLYGSYVTGNWNDLKAVNGGSVDLGGYLDNSAETSGYDVTNLVESGGQFRLTGGTIHGGELINADMLRFDGNWNNTLDAVILDSGLDLSNTGAKLTLSGGTTLVANPTILIGSTTDYWANEVYLSANQDLDLAGATVTFGNGYYRNFLRTLNGHSLTIEADSTLKGKLDVHSANYGGTLTNRGIVSADAGSGGYGSYFGYYFSNVVNEAGATLEAKNSYLELGGNAWNNAGTISSDGGTLNYYGGALTNGGVLQAINGGYLYLNGNLANGAMGSILADGANSRVRLGGNYTTSGLGNVLASNGGEIQLSGHLDNAADTLDLGSIAADGTFRLVDGGSISNGSVASSQNLRFNGSYWNYLENVSLDHGLNLSPYNSVTRIFSGAGLGDGDVKIGRESHLVFGNSQTFDNDIVMEGQENPTWYTRYIHLDSGAALTLGPTASITSDGGGNSSLFWNWVYGPQGSVLNQGLISSGPGAAFYVGGDTITNEGTIEARDGGFLRLDAYNLHNTTGTIQAVGANSIVRTGRDLSTSDLGHVLATDGGELQIANKLTNTGATLDLGSIAATGSVRVIDGGIVGGNVVNSGALKFNGNYYNYLQGVNLDGDLNLEPYNSVTRVFDSLGLGGQVDVGRESYLIFGNSQTFNGHVQMVGGDNPYWYNRYLRNDNYSTLTLGPSAVIDSVGGGYSSLFWAQNGQQGTTINQGLVSAAGAYFYVGGDTLNNEGTIEAVNGGYVRLDSTHFHNPSGTLRADGAGSVVRTNAALTTADLGHVVASDGGELQIGNVLTNTGATLDLSAVAATGAVRVVDGGGIVGGNVTNSGALKFNGNYYNYLQGVSLDGDLNLEPYNSVVRFFDTTQLGGTAKIGRESHLIFANSQTFDGAIQLVQGDNSGGTRRVIVDGTTHLTLGPNSSITSSGSGYGQLFGQWYVGGENSVTNQGLISAGVGANWDLYGYHFINPGTTKADGGQINFYASEVVNSGTFAAANGGLLYINHALNNAGGTIDLTGGGNLRLAGGTIAGGTVTGSQNLLFNWDYNDVLDGVTLGSGLNLHDSQFVRVKNGLTAGAPINMGGNSAAVVFEGNQTFDGGFSLSGGWNYIGAEAATQLTLGPNSSIVGNGSAEIGRHWNASGASKLTNQGSIAASTGADWYVNPEAFQNAGDLSVATGSNIHVQSNSFNQTSGHTDVSGHLYTNAAFNIDGGSLTGTGTIHGSVVNNGLLQPSTGIGTMSITGNYTQGDAGILDLLIGGVDPGQFGGLSILGSASLGGTLSVGFTGGYSPNPGDTYKLLGFNGYNGGTFNLSAADSTFTYALSYSNVGAFLTVAGAPGYVYWIGNGPNSTADWAGSGVWSSPPVSTDKVLNNYADRGIAHSTGTDTIHNFKSVGAFTLSGGTLQGDDPATSTFQVSNSFLLNGGTLKGFTVNPGTGGQGVTVQGTTSVLDGVSVNAGVDLTSGGKLRIGNGTGLHGTTTLSNGAVLAATTDLTLSDGTFAFNGYGDNRLLAEAGTTLTLDGASFTGDRVHLTGDTIVNQGVLSATGASGDWTIDPTGLDNEGTLKASSGAHFLLNPAAYLNLGTVTADGAGSEVGIFGGVADLSTGSLHALNGGTIRIGSILDLAGGSYSGSALAGSGKFLVDGTIKNGTLSDIEALTFSSTGNATLDGVTIDGGLTLSGSERLRLTGGVGGGPITLIDGARLGFLGDATLSNMMVGFYGYNPGFDLADGANLKLGNNLLFLNSGKIDGPASGNATLTIEGAIGLYSGAGLRVDPTDVVVDASGSLTIGSGGTFTMEGGTFTNNANDPSMGHYVHALSGGVLDLSPEHFVNNGVIQVGSVTTANLHPTNWDKVGTLNANGSNGIIRLGGGTISLGAMDTLHAQDGGGFRLETTLDNVGKTLDPDIVGGDFILDGGKIVGGTLNTGSSYLGFSGSYNNVLDGVNFASGAGLTMNGGRATMRGDVINGTGLWHLDANAELTFEASRQFSGQTFLLDNGLLRNVPDIATPGVAPTMVFGNGTTITGKNARVEAVNMISRSRFASEAGGTWYVNVADQLDNSYGDDVTGHGTIEAGTNSALYLHAGRFANNNIILSKQGGWLDATSDVWSRVGTVQSTGMGSTTVLRGGTIVIGLSDGLYAYDGGVIRFGTTLDNTGNWLNPGLVTNTYVNGLTTIGYNGDYAHGGFWGRVKGGGIDSESYALRFDNAELENVSLTTADPAQDGNGNFIHLAGLDLHNEHVKVLGDLKTDYGFGLTNNSSLYFDGNREFAYDWSGGGEFPDPGTAATFTFHDSYNRVGLLGAGTLTLGDGTSLTGAAGSQYTVDMNAGGTLNVQGGSSVSGPNVTFSGGTMNNEIAMGPSGTNSFWYVDPATLNNAGSITAASSGNLSVHSSVVNNTGILGASNSGYAELYGGTWTGVGTLKSSGGSTVRLGGGFTNDGSLDTRIQASSLGEFMLGFGRYRESGDIANAGQTFDPNHTGGKFTFDNGHITGGNLVVTDSASTSYLPLFANSYWNGYGHGDNLLNGGYLVDANGAAAALDLTNGGTLSVANVPAGWNNGQYRLDHGAQLSFNTDTTVDHATIDLGTHGTSAINPFGTTLTLGSDVAFNGINGVVGFWTPYWDPTNKIVNYANISSHDGGTWSVSPYALENHATLSASNGSSLYVTPAQWDKLGLVSVTGADSKLFLGDPYKGGTIQRQDAGDDFQFSSGGRIVLGTHLINKDSGGNPQTIDAVANDGYFEVRGGTIEGGKIRVNAPSDRTISAADWIASYADPRFTFTPGYTNGLIDVSLIDGAGNAAGLDLRNGSSVRITGGFGSSNGYLLGNNAYLSFGGDRDFSGANAATFHFTNGATVNADGTLTLGDGSVVDGSSIAFTGGGLKTETNLTATGTMNISVGTLTDDSTIGIANGGTAWLTPNNWAKVGTLRSDGSGSLMHLAGGTISPVWGVDGFYASGGGAFELNTRLNNASNVAPFDPNAIGGRFTISGGTLAGGSVVSLSPDLRLPSATFDGVKLVAAGGALSGLSLNDGENLLIHGAFDGTTMSNGQFSIDGSSLTFDSDLNRSFGSETHFDITNGQLNQRYDSSLTLEGAAVTGTNVRIGDSWWFGANTGRLSVTPLTSLTAQGSGNVWAITPYRLLNDGPIAAKDGGTVYATVADWQHPGTLRAEGVGSRMVLDGGTIPGSFVDIDLFAEAGSQIELRTRLNNIGTFLDPDLLGGGTLQVGGSDFAFSDNYYSSKGGTILGGKLNTTSDKLVFTHEPMDHSWSTGYDNVLDGVTMTTWDGTTLAGLNLNNGGTVRLANGYSLNGDYGLDNDARITFGDDKTFGAGSNFTFGAGGGTLAVWDHRVVRLEDGVSITGPKATITGDDASRLVNTTAIGPTGAGSHWTISTAITDNQGNLNANDGAKLSLATNVTNHTSRTISATNGGTVEFEGPSPSRGQVTNSGTLSATGGGILSFVNNAQLTNTGLVSVTDGTLNLNTSSVTNTGTIEFEDSALNLAHSSVTSVNPQDWNLNHFTLDASQIVGTTGKVKVGVTESNGAYYMFSPSHDNYFENVDFRVSSAAESSRLGLMDLTNGGYLRVRDSIISAHEIKLGNGGTIAFDNNVAIAADQLTFQGGGSTLNMPMAPGSSLTFANGMTVQGVLGSIGGELPGSPPNTQPRNFVNEASIFIQNNAAQDGAASIDSTSFKNTGTVQLDPNAKLVLNADTLNTGVFQAALGSNITIGAGFVQTDGLLINNGTVDIAAGNVLEIQGGTVKGNGTVNGQVVNGSVLNVGNSPGHMTINGDYSALGTSTMMLEIAGNAQGVSNGYDWLEVNGNVTLGGTLSLSLLNGYDFNANSDFSFLTYTGSLNGAFDTFQPNGADLHGGSLSLVYGPGVVSLHYQTAAVPEPGTMVALGAGILAFAGRRRRRSGR